jgi:integrase
MALTDKWLKAHLNKPQDKRFEKSHREGLSVRVSLNGAITFQYRYYLKHLKKYDRCTIGSYPEVSLAAATAELPRLKVMLAEGKNPKLEIASAKIFESSKLSIEELFFQWYHDYCIKNKATHHEHKRTFEIHVQQKLGKLIADNTTLPTFLSIINPLADKYPSIADRALIDIKQAYKWGRLRQLVTTDPLADISAKVLGIESGQDTRFFNHQEIKWFWQALENTRIEEKNKIFIELAFHYGCRPKELRTTEISHINLDMGLWSVPWENHKIGQKTKQPIVRPIIKDIKHLWIRAIELSNSKKWVFTNRDDHNQIGKCAIPASMECIDNYWRKKIKVDGDPIKYEPFHLYTLRKTARTNFSDFGDWATCEKMVGHKLPGETDKYDYSTYANKMKPIYQAWFDLNQKIRDNKNNVSSIDDLSNKKVS